MVDLLARQLQTNGHEVRSACHADSTCPVDHCSPPSPNLQSLVAGIQDAPSLDREKCRRTAVECFSAERRTSDYIALYQERRGSQSPDGALSFSYRA